MHAHTRVQRNVVSVLGKETRWFGSCSVSKTTQAELLPHLVSGNCCDWTKCGVGVTNAQPSGGVQLTGRVKVSKPASRPPQGPSLLRGAPQMLDIKRFEPICLFLPSATALPPPRHHELLRQLNVSMSTLTMVEVRVGSRF